MTHAELLWLLTLNPRASLREEDWGLLISFFTNYDTVMESPPRTLSYYLPIYSCAGLPTNLNLNEYTTITFKKWYVGEVHG